MQETLSYWLGQVGIAAFAITAVLAVLPKGVDIFGATILGMLTALGGGTLRDIVLGVPVFWATDATYLLVSALAAALAFFAKDLFGRRGVHRSMLYLDGLGVAMFAILAMGKTWHLEFGRPASPIILGVVTAVGGGLIRDTLANRRNLLMTSHDLYLTPVLFGCGCFGVVLRFFPDQESWGALFSMAVIFTIRSLAIHFSWSVPSFLVARRSLNDEGE